MCEISPSLYQEQTAENCFSFHGVGQLPAISQTKSQDDSVAYLAIVEEVEM